MLNRLNYEGVPGAAELVVPETGEYDPAKITLNVVPALHYGAVLDSVWIDLVEVGGAVLRRGFVDAGGVDKWRGSIESVRQIEYIANKLELAYATKHDERGVPREFLVDIAAIVAEIWKARATTLFPDRVFDVYFDSTDDESPVVHLEQDDGGVAVPFRE